MAGSSSGDFFTRAEISIKEDNNVYELQRVVHSLGIHLKNIEMPHYSISALMNMLYTAAQEPRGFEQVFLAILRGFPLSYPCVGYVNSYIIEYLPLPPNEVILEFAGNCKLTEERAKREDFNVKIELNICTLLGCLAKKLVGVNSEIIFTKDIMEYLCTLLINRQYPLLALQALIALEKFAITDNNKDEIQQYLTNQPVNPLLKLELFADVEHTEYRQLGFCAKWALENTFPVPGRPLSYERVNMKYTNVIMKMNPDNNLLKPSANGLEVRNDAENGEGLRSTKEVKKEVWYYEVKIISEGLMEFGYATTATNFLNDKYLGINTHSIGYDGWRRAVWFDKMGKRIRTVPQWKPGDVVGCLLDIPKKEIIFTLNGIFVDRFVEVFKTDGYSSKKDLRFYAAACLFPAQQAFFNFGTIPFAYPPTDRMFSAFNDYGKLTDEEKTIKPRLIKQREMVAKDVHTSADTCVICYNGTPSVTLKPCGHKGFCADCALRFEICPICRSEIDTEVPRGDNADHDMLYSDQQRFLFEHDLFIVMYD